MVRIVPGGEYAAQVDGAADGAERPGKLVERMDISVQHEAQVRQLLGCQTGVLAWACFEPGAFADRAALEQMPATSCRT